MMSRLTVACLGLALAAAAGAAACPGGSTPALTAGPYYTQGSPQRTVLRESSSAGKRLVLSGVVYDEGCRSVAGAWIDFWQADGRGRYDNEGFGFRGHQLTDAAGRYILDTVVPGEYPGRTSHIHVKVRAPGGPVLTTQLFLPGQARNRTDGIFDQDLVMTIQDSAGSIAASFDFRVPTR